MNEEYEIAIPYRKGGVATRGSVDVSRISVIADGKYLHLYPSAAIVEKMKADGWTTVKAFWKLNADREVVGIRLAKADEGDSSPVPSQGASPRPDTYSRRWIGNRRRRRLRRRGSRR